LTNQKLPTSERSPASALSPLGIFDELCTSSVPSSGTPFHGLCCPASGEPDPTAVANRAIAQEPRPARRQVHAVELAALRASPLWLVPDELFPRRTRPRQKPAVEAQQAGGQAFNSIQGNIRTIPDRLPQAQRTSSVGIGRNHEALALASDHIALQVAIDGRRSCAPSIGKSSWTRGARPDARSGGRALSRPARLPYPTV
jgi:hypothetical protein